MLTLAVEVSAYGLWLLLVGVRQVSLSAADVWFEPHPAGYIPLLGARTLIVAALARHLYMD